VFELVNDFIEIVSPQPENWPNIAKAINLVDRFIASAVTKDGPVHVRSTVWGRPLAKVLQENFSCSWTVYLCLGRGGQVIIEPRSSKSRDKNAKRPIKKSVPISQEPEIEALLNRKRSFSDLNREYDREMEQVSERLEQLDEEP